MKKVFVRGEYTKSITLEKNVKAISHVINAATKHTLSDKETNELVAKAKAGDANAQQAIIEDNLGLVISVARSYQFMTFENNAIDLGDFISEGCIGITYAIKAFDASKGNFSNLAIAYIRREIVSFIDSARIVRTYDRNTETYRHDSLDDSVGDDGDTFADFLTSDTLKINTDVDSLATDLARVLANVLSERDAEIVRLSFFAGESNYIISVRYNMTEERVRQILAASIEKIRNNADATKLLRRYLR